MAPASEPCFQPGAERLQRGCFLQQARAQGQDIGIVVLPTQAGGGRIQHTGRADPWHLVGSHMAMPIPVPQTSTPLSTWPVETRRATSKA